VFFTFNYSTVDFSAHVKLGVSNISSTSAYRHPAKHPSPNYLDLIMSERNTPSTVVFDGIDFDYCKVGLTPETTNLKVRYLQLIGSHSSRLTIGYLFVWTSAVSWE
jgi:hypothetical protein